MVLETHDELIAAYLRFRDRVYAPVHVLHGGCATDVCAALAFGKDKVTFVDTNDEAMEELRLDGYRALTQDIRRYRPQRLHDVCISINFGSPEWQTPHARKGAFILVNNYHGDAKRLHDDAKRFELWGYIHSRPESSGYDVTLSRDISDLFVRVESFAELQRIDSQRYIAIERTQRAHLVNSGVTPAQTPEERCMQFCRLMGTQEELPYRRDPTLYIFVKRELEWYNAAKQALGIVR